MVLISNFILNNNSSFKNKFMLWHFLPFLAKCNQSQVYSTTRDWARCYEGTRKKLHYSYWSGFHRQSVRIFQQLSFVPKFKGNWHIILYCNCLNFHTHYTRNMVLIFLNNKYSKWDTNILKNHTDTTENLSTSTEVIKHIFKFKPQCW